MFRQNMLQIVKFIVCVILRLVLRIFYIFPVKKNRIMFSSWGGDKGFSCNPKVIFEQMYERFGDEYEYIWALNDKTQLPAKYKNAVKIVHRFPNLSFMFYIMTSKLIINNHGYNYLPKRKSQILINTWHGGGAYKGIVNRKGGLFIIVSRKLLKFAANNTTYFIASNERMCAFFEDEVFIARDKFLKIGMPRNDIFFDKEKVRLVSEEIKKQFNLPSDNLILLYAPTYRCGQNVPQDVQNEVLDIQRLIHALEARFGKKVTILSRAHSVFHGNLHFSFNESFLDVTSYPDMQELLCATDVLITDFSSSMWDFALLERPGFLFVPDLENYTAHTCTFITPIESWPFKYAKTNDELCALVAGYSDEENKRKIHAHQNALKSFEKGTACDQVIAKIRELTQD